MNKVPQLCLVADYKVTQYQLLIRKIMSKLPQKPQSNIGAVMPSICLQVGMRVLIKNDTKKHLFDAGKIKTITKQLPDFGKLKAFALDNDEGIWCIENFEKCVDYPDAVMS
jgi:hypothetical protein